MARRAQCSVKTGLQCKPARRYLIPRKATKQHSTIHNLRANSQPTLYMKMFFRAPGWQQDVECDS